ncbi:hypothetical protein CPB86DRAFT_772968 [Serendipita vermifera]|nr:hypothetical protein CPB86DRAFT_772968 [Serendipita vermifera]
MAVNGSLDVIKLLVDTLVILKATSYLAGALLVIVLYDWLLTLEEEVHLILPTNWTIVKTLYFVIRVVSPTAFFIANYHLTGLRGPLSDNAWIWFIMFTSLIIMGSSNYLILRRLCPLYGNDRTIVYFLNTAFFVTYVIVSTLSILGAKRVSATMTYSAPVDMCSSLSMDEIKEVGSGIFVGPMPFESIVFLMTLWKALIAARSNQTMYSTPLHQIFFRGKYMSSRSTMRIVNVVIYYGLPLQYYYIGVFLLWGTFTTSTTRLFINLREIARGPDIWSSKFEIGSISQWKLTSLPRRGRSTTPPVPVLQHVMISVVTESV